jgi:DUF1365 family protein
MKSCIYEGQVRHRRLAPTRHVFKYRLFLLYLDLEELPGLFNRYWLWSGRRFNLAWFRRRDHLGEPQTSLPDAVREQVKSATGLTVKGPIRLLTHLRYFGFGFNPVSFYYCFDESDSRIEAIVCEVNNTPWGEQFTYVLKVDESSEKGNHLNFRQDKQFHVSPFMPMDVNYNWRFSWPDDILHVHMANLREQQKIFDASLALKRKQITSFQLARVLLLYPAITLKVVAAIYFEAIRLWLKKLPFYSHPKNLAKTPTPIGKQ